MSTPEHLRSPRPPPGGRYRPPSATPAIPGGGILLADGKPAPPSPAQRAAAFQKVAAALLHDLAAMPDFGDEVKALHDHLAAHPEALDEKKRSILAGLQIVARAQKDARELIERRRRFLEREQQSKERGDGPPGEQRAQRERAGDGADVSALPVPASE